MQSRDEINAYHRDLYAYYKAHGICVNCGQREAAPNRVRCEECLAKNAASNERHRLKETPKQREKRLESERKNIRKIRAKRRADGKCIECGKPLSPSSTCFCIDCKIRNQRKNGKHNAGIVRSERPSYGFCYRCGRPIQSGRICNDCKNISTKNLPEKMNPELYRYNKDQNRAIFGG